MAETEPEPVVEETDGRVVRLPEPDKEAHQAAIQTLQDDIAVKQGRMVSSVVTRRPLLRRPGRVAGAVGARRWDSAGLRAGGALAL